MANREIYRREDIRNALNAVLAANLLTMQAANTPESLDFARGFVAAVRAAASAFALEGEIDDPVRRLPKSCVEHFMEESGESHRHLPILPEVDPTDEEPFPVLRRRWKLDLGSDAASRGK